MKNKKTLLYIRSSYADGTHTQRDRKIERDDRGNKKCARKRTGNNLKDAWYVDTISECQLDSIDLIIQFDEEKQLGGKNKRTNLDFLRVHFFLLLFLAMQCMCVLSHTLSLYPSYCSLSIVFPLLPVTACPLIYSRSTMIFHIRASSANFICLCVCVCAYIVGNGWNVPPKLHTNIFLFALAHTTASI